MKYVWQPEDIESGRYFTRGGKEGYSMSCLHKIGTLMPDADEYAVVAVAMTDGCVIPYGVSDEEFAASLNEGEYIPISAYDAARVITKEEEAQMKKGYAR